MRAGLLVLPYAAGAAASTYVGVPAVDQARRFTHASGYAPTDEVRVKLLNGTWQVVGRGALRGVTPIVSSVQADEYGSARLEMTLRRDPSANWPDLQAFSDVDYLRDGMLAWSGRIRETPSRGNRDQWEIAASCEGWQAHLDDDVMRPCYVDTNQGSWRDYRDYLTADLTAYTAAWNVSNTDGGVAISLPNGTAVVNKAAGVMFDAGPGATIQRLAFTVSHGAWGGTATMYRSSGPTVALGDAAVNLRNIAAAGSGALVQTTLATPRRYVLVYILFNGTATDANWFRFDSVLAASSTAYESAGASALTADDVVLDALPKAPLLDQSTSLISAGTFTLPSYAPGQFITPREALDAVNTYEGYRAMVDVQRRLVYSAYPTTPEIEVYGELDDSSPTTVDDVTTRAVLETTDGASVAITADRTTTATTLAGQRGVTRSIVLNPSSPMTQAGADRAADIYLAEHARAAMRGTITIRRGDARTVLGGRPVDPAELLLRVGEQLRLARYRDPITGASHRDARIVNVDYSPAEDAAKVSLDATRNQLDTLLARYAAVVGQ